MPILEGEKVTKFFGGLAAAGSLITDPTKRYMESNLFLPFKNKVEILISNLPDSNAAVMGAGALVWDQFKNDSKHDINRFFRMSF